MRRRVAIIGRTRLAVAALDTVRRAGDEVAAVIVDHDDDGVDGWQPSLRAAADRADLPVMDPSNVNDPAFVARIAELGVDHLLSFQAGPILRAPLIATAGIAALNLHYGPLPRYRGVAPIAWAIINGEEATGVTLHHIDPGVDSGPLVRSVRVPIHATDTGRTLYDRCVDAGIALFGAAWPEVRLPDTVPSSAQDPAAALYYNRWALDFGQRRVRWDDDCARVANRMRAFIFPPFQYPEVAVGERILQIGAVSWDRLPHRGHPGEVVAHEDGHPVVGAAGGRITIRELRVNDVPVPGTAELAPGTRLA